MRSSAEASAHPRTRIRRLVDLALLVSASLVLFLFESIIPAPLPWVRLGLANVMTVAVLYLYGTRDAFLLTIFRVVLGSLLLGSFLAPAFFLSLGGGLAAAAVMAAARALASRWLSIVGISVLGAVAHNAGQLVILSLFFLRGPDAVHLLPYLTLSATLLGAFTGFAARALVGYLAAREADASPNDTNDTESS
ncbi:MAG: Gx transporter family protein [bacterium]